MKSLRSICIVALIFLSCNTQKSNPIKDYEMDREIINKTIAAWDKAWEDKNLEMALQYYAEKTDWTNAFGDRVQSKEDLRKLLGFIFNMDFVMAGENDYGDNEIIFLNDSIATVRSLNIRKNQKWPDGSKMEDRHINHLRVYEKINGDWLITNHMISQAWPKQRAKDSIAE